ncbi:MAG: isocitrate lyase/PEP mutase family protein [Deltaproteobacteria bacterium]|nr:isocitrate lyase/PEP mutase family protein [Deltaproteobacteria bacterium]
MRKTTRLRKLLETPGIVAMPCSYDSLTAKLIEKTGYKIVGVTGAGLCAAILGVPDVGLMTMTEVLNQTKNIVNATNLPVICDCDNGYGGPINIIRTVREFEEAGVAGFWIEDQVSPKRCGHFEGKQIVSREAMIVRIEAAVDARRDSELVIIARTDARAVLGLDEAISRARDYVKAGADMIFIEAPRSKDELRKIASSIEAPQMVNLVEGGKTPLVTIKELEEMGFKIASFSGSSQKIAIKAIQKFLADFHETGDIRLYLDDMVSLEERSQLLGLDVFYKLERKFLTPAGK